jgi:hypothetical protein
MRNKLVTANLQDERAQAQDPLNGRSRFKPFKSFKRFKSPAEERLSS